MQFLDRFTVPDWYLNYKAFPEALLNRNRWFVRTRFLAVGLLVIILCVFHVVSGIAINSARCLSLAWLPLGILAYNIYFRNRVSRCSETAEYRQLLRLALVQVAADLMALALLVYFTGGVESPFSLLFVFHMVIGGLIFPAGIVVIIASVVLFYYNSFCWLEYARLVPHFSLSSLLPEGLYLDPRYVVFNTVTISGVLTASAYIAYKIATDMISLQGSLHNAFVKLEKAESEKQKYVIAVVHEIKQPVTAVTSYLQIISKGYLGAVSEQISEVVNKCINRNSEAIEMINSILKISRLKLANQMQSGQVNLAEVLTEIEGRYTPVIAGKNIELSSRFPGQGIIISGDRFLLNLALSNLFGNAVKYTPERGRIELEMKEENSRVQITIKDTGIGIPKKDIPELFNDFFRASNLTGNKTEGAGVGLSIVKQVIEQHQGTIAIDSPSGIGNADHPGTSVTVLFAKK